MKEAKSSLYPREQTKVPLLGSEDEWEGLLLPKQRFLHKAGRIKMYSIRVTFVRIPFREKDVRSFSPQKQANFPVFGNKSNAKLR